MQATGSKPVQCLVLDDDQLDYAYTTHCLHQIFGVDGINIVHAVSIDQAAEALGTIQFDLAILDYYVGARTPMTLLRHFEDSQRGCAVIVLSSVHPSIVKPFLNAIGNCAFMDKTVFSPAALTHAVGNHQPAAQDNCDDGAVSVARSNIA